MPYPIPHQTDQAFQTFKRQPNHTQNASLLFERYTPMIERESGDEKQQALKDIVRAAKQADKALLTGWVQRWRALTTVAHAEPFTAKTDWRFVTGLGRKGALEVGFTFHRYGFPILPGSSVKGVARAYARLALDMQDSDDTDAPPDFIVVFGRAPQKGETDDAAQAGGAIFFDALPEKPPALVVDIMNPHYPDYYRDKGVQPPTNWQNPIPVTFLTVEAGTPFCFAVGWRGEWNVEAKRLQALAVDWLKGGLSELGAGAKTTAGYGYFSEPKSSVAPSPATPAKAGAVVGPGTESAATPHSSPAEMRTGTIIEIRPDKHFGKLRDTQTGTVYRFDTRVIEGDTPATKAKVVYHLQTGQVVKVKRG